METTRIPLSQCVESSYQNRKELGDVSGLARSIEVNGQITPLIVVADGEAYQLVAGHRRTAAMRSLGLEEADAYVMDGWDDARIAQILNAENNHRKELTEAERGRGIQTMLSLGVPVADAAVSADIPEDKAESYVRGTKVVPVDAVNLDFEAVALMVLTSIYFPPIAPICPGRLRQRISAGCTNVLLPESASPPSSSPLRAGP